VIARKILGSLLIDENEFEAALEQLRLLEDIEQDSSDTRFKIALINLQQKKFDKAEQELEILLAEQPNHSAARYYLATIMASTERPQKAIEQISFIPKTDPLYPKANAFASFISRESGNIEAALASIEKAYQADQGQSPQIFVYYVTVLREAGRLKEARSLLEDAISKQPEEYDLRYDYVITLYEMDEVDDALDEARSIISAKPDHTEALNFISFILAERGTDLSIAEELIRRAISLRPKEGYFHDTLGWVLLKQGKLNESIEELRRANSFLPRDFSILEHLADALLLQGKKNEAIEIYDRAIESLQNLDSFSQKKSAPNLEKILHKRSLASAP
jgi:tetratricopeptide (TPR) repeat protein